MFCLRVLMCQLHTFNVYIYNPVGALFCMSLCSLKEKKENKQTKPKGSKLHRFLEDGKYTKSPFSPFYMQKISPMLAYYVCNEFLCLLLGA